MVRPAMRNRAGALFRRVRMQDRLIGYLLQALEVEEITVVEQWLAGDQQAVIQMRTLQLALTPLKCCTGDCDSPPGLAPKTCEKIRQQWAARCEAPAAENPGCCTDDNDPFRP